MPVVRRAGALACMLAVLSWVGASRSQAQGERLVAMVVDATVEPTGSLFVRESITWDFARQPEKHGIFRFIPERHRWDGERKPQWDSFESFDRVTDVRFGPVQSSTGAPTKANVSTESSNAVLRIGDKDQTVSGTHTYQLEYRIDRAVLDGRIDFSLTGTGWTVPVDLVSATIRNARPGTEALCRRHGALDRSCWATVDGGTIRLRGSGTGLSVMFDVDPAIAPEPLFVPVISLRRSFDWTNGQPVPVVGVFAAVLALLAAIARRGRDRVGAPGPASTIGAGPDAVENDRVRSLGEKIASPVEFAPPDGVPPGLMQSIRKGRVTSRDYAATLVDLAVRGFVLVEPIVPEGKTKPKDHRITRTEGKGNLRPYEKKLLDALFSMDSSVTFSELKERKSLASALSGVRLAMLAESTKDGYWRGRPDLVKTKWVMLGFLATLVGVAVTIGLAVVTRFAMVGLPLIIFGLGLMIISPTMGVRTGKGSTTAARITGFEKLFDAGEGERLEVASNMELFSSYLPYAMAFGNVDKWVRQFSTLGDMPSTPWYGGPGAVIMGRGFSDSMDGFESALSSAMSAASATSSSGGGGGGGGGSSGGGGGGSW